jgi:hypothetical protein
MITTFAKIPGSKEFQDLTASIWVNTTCRDIQTALKLAIGEEYDKLYPGSIYSPPSYNENFLQQRVKVIDAPLSIRPSCGCIDTHSKID